MRTIGMGCGNRLEIGDHINKCQKKDYSSWKKDDLIKRIEGLEKRKKYGLVWDEESTKEEFEAASQGKLPVLVEDESKEIHTDDDRAD